MEQIWGAGTAERCKGELKRSKKLTKAINALKDIRIIKASPGNGVRIQNLC